jgi:phosphoglycolate phosphatase-like HAD superfamily hydrolase
MIGDSLSDVQAGRAAGCHTALIASHDHEGMADITDGTLESISWQILRRDEAHAA